ncbi:hypothetical protein KGQ19_46545 [Catenulispora sp. NL8]|uniref:Uncharacterized protein n=1 Tax=Catenulispora pinistramenti TaxID=2705254 RepID=A0ABS5L8E3_9ACTN|nr:hypothetical protein [Catenulispora pinistramenti]MBS2554340.1 hypothetical protein [Catenulispora pinistramenti]
MNGDHSDDHEIGRPGYRVDQIRHLTGSATRRTPPGPGGYLRARAAVATGLTLYAWTWGLGIFNAELWTTAVAAMAAMRTARRSADPDASDLSLTLATLARYASGAWLLWLIPTALYTMHTDGIAALLTYLFKTP